MDNSPWEQGQYIRDAVYCTRLADRYRKLWMPTEVWGWFYTRCAELNKLRNALYHVNLRDRLDAAIRRSENGESYRFYTGKF